MKGTPSLYLESKMRGNIRFWAILGTNLISPVEGERNVSA